MRVYYAIIQQGFWQGQRFYCSTPLPQATRRSCMPPGPAWHWFNTRPEQGTCTRCEDLRPTWNRGGGDMPPPQLMSEPFPRDKVEMTRNMSCGEATSLQHNKNTWLNPNYNPARRTSANQHDDEQWPIYSQQPSPALLIYNLTKTQGGRAGKI